MNKKRIMTFLLVIMMSFTFIGCSSGIKEYDVPNVKGKTYDVGEFTVLVPKGWEDYNQPNPDGDTVISPRCVKLGKGTQYESELESKPHVQIDYYGQDREFISSKKDFKDAKDIDPFKLDGRKWTGYDSNDSSQLAIYLESTDDNGTIQVILYNYKSSKDQIKFDDEDVLAILASIKTKKQK